MEKTSTEKDQGAKMSFNVEKYPPVELTRKFNAPVERVWEAWTSPELMKQWWGPEGYSCPEAKMDVREGGKSVLAMKSPDGQVMYSGGVYQEIVPNKKIVSTDYFMDKNGNYVTAESVGMPGEWSEEQKMTIEFSELGENSVQIHIFHEGIPSEMHDDCVLGWSSSIDKLQKLVERNS